MKQSIIALSLLIGFSLMGVVPKAEGFRGDPCARVLSSYKGVSAKSNQSYPYGSCGGKSVYGLRYQCVEYVRRFYHQVKGIETRNGMMGNRWSGDANTYFKTADEKGLKAFKNGGSVPPQPDDILTFRGGLYGHIAIVTSVTKDYVEFIEQNLSRSGTSRLPYNPVTHRMEDRDFPGVKLVLEGWLRPRLHSS